MRRLTMLVVLALCGCGGGGDALGPTFDCSVRPPLQIRDTPPGLMVDPACES